MFAEKVTGAMAGAATPGVGAEVVVGRFAAKEPVGRSAAKFTGAMAGAATAGLGAGVVVGRFAAKEPAGRSAAKVTEGVAGAALVVALTAHRRPL